MAETGEFEKRPQVLILMSYFRPAFKAGGPIRSIENVVSRLGGELSFSIVTRDRDLGDSREFEGLALGQWIEEKDYRIFYVPKSQDGFLFRCKLLKATPHDILYLTSCFGTETVFSLVARRLMLVPRRRVLISPRGEFTPGALRLKRRKKMAYLFLAKLLGLFDGVIWHATNEAECGEIAASAFKNSKGETSGHIVMAPEIAGVPTAYAQSSYQREKKLGEASVVLLGRISRMKNWDYALSILSRATGKVHVDIIAPHEDERYWKECEEIIERLPDNVHVDDLGCLPPQEIQSKLLQYHLSILPSLGENFGYTIVEALSAGCPVLISDRTPWRGLEGQKAGWDIPLENKEGFVAALRRVIDMGQDEFAQWSQGAAALAKKYNDDMGVVEASRRLFLGALDDHAHEEYSRL